MQKAIVLIVSGVLMGFAFTACEPADEDFMQDPMMQEEPMGDDPMGDDPMGDDPMGDDPMEY